MMGGDGGELIQMINALQDIFDEVPGLGMSELPKIAVRERSTTLPGQCLTLLTSGCGRSECWKELRSGVHRRDILPAP